MDGLPQPKDMEFLYAKAAEVRDLCARCRDYLAHHGRICSLTRGAVIADATGVAAFFVLSGQVKRCFHSNTKDFTIELGEAGDFFAFYETVFFDLPPRSYFQFLRKSRLFVLDLAAFRQLDATCSCSVRLSLALMAKKLHFAEARLSILAEPAGVRARLFAEMRLGAVIGLSQAQIAKLLAITPETFSRSRKSIDDGQ